MPGLKDLVESQLPKRKPTEPSGVKIKVATPPLYGFGPTQGRLPVTKVENPFYVPGELLPGKPDILRPGMGVDTLNYKSAADERSAQALHRDAGILDSYYQNLSKKGMSEDEIIEVLKSLAEDQKKARMQFYAKPVEMKIEEN